MRQNRQSGFTAIELLISLFVAAAFLMSGFQLFTAIIKDGGNARAQARASNVAYDYLRRYSAMVGSTCTTSNPENATSVSVAGLSSVEVSVAITCPYAAQTSLSKIDVTVDYNSPTQSVSYATYVNSGGSQASSGVASVISSGLILNLDASRTDSYPGTGTLWSDLSSSNNSGTLANGPTYNSANGGSIVFDGTDDLVNILSSPSMQFGQTFSVSLWVYPTSLASRYGIFTTRTTNATGSWQLEVGTGNGGTGRVSVTGQGTWLWDSANSVISTNNWYYITYVKPNNATVGGTVYINGTVRSPVTTTAYTILNNSDQVQVAAGTSGGMTFPGRIGSVHLYNRALSAAEVTSNYNTTKSRFGL